MRDRGLAVGYRSMASEQWDVVPEPRAMPGAPGGYGLSVADSEGNPDACTRSAATVRPFASILAGFPEHQAMRERTGRGN